MATVILVTSEVDLVVIVSDRLRMNNYTVLTVETSEQDMSLVGAAEVIGVLLDLDCATLEPLAQRCPNVPVIGLSIRQHRGRLALHHGASMYLHKPLDFSALIMSLSRLVSHRSVSASVATAVTPAVEMRRTAKKVARP